MEKIGFLAPQIAARAKKEEEEKTALKARSDVWFRGIVFLSGCDTVSLVNKGTIPVMPPKKYLALPLNISICSETNQLASFMDGEGEELRGGEEGRRGRRGYQDV